MTRYIKAMDFFVIITLLLLGIGLIGLGIAYDSFLFQSLKENKKAIGLYNQRFASAIDKTDPQQVFSALVIMQKYNTVIIQKDLTFHFLFIIGLCLSSFSIFYLLSTVINGLTEEMQMLQKDLDEMKHETNKTSKASQLPEGWS
jgi:hypothetical protein